MKTYTYIAAAALATMSMTSYAGNTIAGTSFGNSNTYSTTFADGVNANFTTSAGNFEMKSGGLTVAETISGVGITSSKGGTSGEIDIGETITGTFSTGVQFSSIRLGLLFDGPEYGDVNEVAQITAFWTGGSAVYTLTAKDVHSALWSGLGSTVSSIGSGAVLGGTGAWDIFNPFGDQLVTKLTFTALPGLSASTCSTCKNQSDYTLVSVTAVPESKTYAMMLVGLGLMGTIARRRKSVFD
jgi:hypothetical protein